MTGLRNIENTEVFQFESLKELRDWLNMFKTTDLDMVLPSEGDYYQLTWEVEILSDGSEVENCNISTIY